MGWGAAIGAAGSLLGSAFSGKQAASNSKRQVEFQKEMSRTAYQRAATDLEKAGLNRVIALGNAASTPPGSVPQVPDYGDAISRGAQAGSGVSTARMQRELLATENDLKQRQASLTDAQKDLADNNAKLVFEQTRSAAADADAKQVVKAAAGAVLPYVEKAKAAVPAAVNSAVEASKPVTDWIRSKVRGSGSSAKDIDRRDRDGDGYVKPKASERFRDYQAR